MNLKLIGFCFLMAFKSSTIMASVGYNHKILDMEATTFVTVSSCNQEMSVDDIKRSLTFVYDEKLIEKKYSQPSYFQELCTKISELIDSSFVIQSFENCKEIYDNGDQKEKISIHLFLEQVYKKYFELKKIIQRQNKTFEKEAPRVYSDKDDVFKSFFDNKPQKVK
jgi:hypothetical protein